MKTARIELRMSPEELKNIDDFRTNDDGNLSRAEAIRILVRRGLDDTKSKIEYNSARLQILTTGLSTELFSDAYLYAWDNEVYPDFDEGADWHKPFKAQFKIGPGKINELINFLDDLWIKDVETAKHVPTFYELEDKFGVRYGSGDWTRFDLIKVLRYCFLNNDFNQQFYDALLKGFKHPTEAKSIIRKFNRKADIYLN